MDFLRGYYPAYHRWEGSYMMFRGVSYCVNEKLSIYLFKHIIFFFGEGNGNLLQYSYLENSMDGGAW